MAKSGDLTEITIKKNKKNDVEIEDLLKELGHGYKYRIFRKEPDWCNGQVGTFDIDPNEPLSVDDIRRRFGGRKLTLSIVNPDGSYLLSRVLDFPDPPRGGDGVELVPGPAGVPVRADRLQEAIENAKKMPEPTPAPAPVVNDSQNMLLKTMIEIQAQNYRATQDMQSKRIEHLEALLENRSAPRLEAAPAADGRPFDGLRDTLKIIKEIEEIRGVLGTVHGAPMEDQGLGWQGAIEKMLDFVLEKEKTKMQIQQSNYLAGQVPPPLPLPGIPAGIPPAPPAPSGVVSDAVLIENLQKRLQSVDAESKAQILQAILGDEIEEVISFIPEPENTANPENQACGDNENGLGSNLISAEDRARLESDNAPNGNKKP